VRNRLRFKYKDIRKEFKIDIYNLAKENKAIVMMILETYSAMKHRNHIHKIWQLLGFNHDEAYKDYCKNLMGKMLTGKDEIYNSLGYVDPDLYKKYRMKLPERLAMGDSLAIAYKVIREEIKNKTMGGKRL
jgi:hypothetical protein